MPCSQALMLERALAATVRFPCRFARVDGGLGRVRVASSHPRSRSSKAEKGCPHAGAGTGRTKRQSGSHCHPLIMM
jgi:hypothetical protein